MLSSSLFVTLVQIMHSERVMFVFIIVLLWIYCTESFNAKTDEIKLTQGNLRGEVNWRNGYKSYLGIPYASVVKRFQDAGPAPTWNETLFANKGSIKCSQFFTVLKIPIGQENCLVLNVFTPINTDNTLLPVMVFIPGGAFKTDSNTDIIYNPKFLVQKNVIVVTINYRIGAFGFLCLHEVEAPGNIGLKDQITALNWVKDNIKAFGGNPEGITVFGESAGASSIHYMIITEKYKGLFNKAILQSGSALSPSKFDNDPIKSASYVASRMGFKTEDPKQLLKIFQSAPANHIVKASYVDSTNQPLKPRIFRPCIEKEKDDNSYLTENPRKLVASKKLGMNLSMILGYNDKEGLTLAGDYNTEGIRQLNSTLSQLIPKNIIFTGESENTTLTQDIRKFYFNGGITYDSLTDFFSDSEYIYPLIESTFHLISSNAKVYNYYFKYDSFRNLYKFISRLPYKPGADHADDLFYIFDPEFSYLLPPSYGDFKFIDTLTTLWTDFAKTRNPTAHMDFEWVQSKDHILKYLQLDKEIKMIPLPNIERFIFWKQIYKTYTAY